ncbi:restriction endonuclease subunit S [Paraburkholderia sp. J94]|uniref:restriction endonuclease subunit S n=1 Tax=Paraburkholderia sp. J94 TaxID=2805441 RepID=UPI002AAF97A4|nr:restriction endonuclease subunit S [Paraburkholderia sp. J94]
MSSKTKATATAEEAKPAQIPKLRFPEFRKEDEWQVKKLNELLFEPKKRNRSLEFGPADVLSVSGQHGCVNQIEFMGRSYAGVSVKDYHIVETGDIVYTKSPLKKNPFGIIKVNKGKRGIVSTLYAVYRPFANCSGIYLDHFFSGDYNLNAYLQPLVKKGAKNDMKVNNTDVLKGDICVPKFAEQQKIAKCLSSMDELIAAQARKVGVLKTHKNGLMQQLFPREDKTFPSLRLPEFQGKEGWKSLPLAALADKIMVGIASAATHAYRETGVPMLRNQNIKEGGIDDSSLLFIDPIYEATHKNKRLKAGDVITVRTGYPGLSAVVTKSYENAQCFTSLITRPKADILDSNYLCLYINSPIGKKFMLGAEAGGAQKNVNAGTLGTLEVYFPQLEEQRKIASILSNFDALISAETQKLEALAIHKKGLTQQLFPSAEGIDA